MESGIARPNVGTARTLFVKLNSDEPESQTPQMQVFGAL